MHRPVLYLHADLIADIMLAPGVAVAELTSYHSAYNTGFVYIMIRVIDSLDSRAVPQDGYLVCNVGDLIELMGDYDRCHTVLLEAFEQIKEHSRVLFVKGRRGLVKYKKLYVLAESLCYLHKLLLACTYILDKGEC